jgi:beta-xylosidase
MKTGIYYKILLATVTVAAMATPPPQALAQDKKTSGNPVVEGWYADPEAKIFNKQYWLYPTYSAKYNEQVYMDAFSSPDLVHWTKHPHIIDTSGVKWVKRALWAPAVTQKGNKYYIFFGANDIQNNNEKGGIGVAVADNPGRSF